MSILSGAVVVPYTLDHWLFFINDKGPDGSDGAYLSSVIMGPDDQRQKSSLINYSDAQNVEPRAFVHPADGNLYCFHITGGAHHIGANQVQTVRQSDGSSKLIRADFKLSYTHPNPKNISTSITELITNNGGNFGVTWVTDVAPPPPLDAPLTQGADRSEPAVVGDGFLVTHGDASNEELWLSYYRLGDIDSRSNQWSAFASYKILSTTAASHAKDTVHPNFLAQTSTLVADTEGGCLRLVVAYLKDPTHVGILEWKLSESLAPQLADDYVYVPPTAITSARLFLHTGPDGRASLSYYRDSKNACFASRGGKPATGAARTWTEQIIAIELPKGGELRNAASVPTAAYFPGELEATTVVHTAPDTGVETPLTEWRVPVTRRLTVAVRTKNDDSGPYPLTTPGDRFGTAYRGELIETGMSDTGVLLGFIEGGIPMPWQNLSVDYETWQSSTLSLKASDKHSTAATVSAHNSFVMESEGYIAKGIDLLGKGGMAGVAWKFSLETGTGWVKSTLKSMTHNTNIEQAINEFRRPSQAELTQFGSAAAGATVGTMWPADTGTAFLLKMSLAGFKYRFIPAGYSDPADASIPDDIPWLAEFTPKRVDPVAIPYYINPADVIPGALTTYMDPGRSNKLDQMKRASFGGQLPSFSYSASGAGEANTPSVFSSSNSVKEAFLDVSGLIGVYWHTDALFIKSEGQILAGGHHEYSRAVEQGEEYELSLEATMDLHGSAGEPGIYYTYVTHIHFVVDSSSTSPDESIASQFKRNLTYGMSGAKLEKNNSLVAMIDFENSNPWKICFTVSSAMKNAPEPAAAAR